MNKVTLIGEISDRMITCIRPSGLTDTLPIQTPITGFFRVTGQLHTYNTPTRHLKLFVQPDSIDQADLSDSESNTVELTGYVCRSPIYRITPGGKEICEINLAVPRNNSQSDYIPCIAWGKNAKKASLYIIGSEISIRGRIQSREYLKEGIPKTTYEVSIGELL